MVWQVYDWYLQAHAGYYGTKIAGEPVHIQFNRDSMNIVVVNSLHKEIPKASIQAVLYNSNLESLWHSEDTVTLPVNRVYKTGWVVPVQDQLGFLRLIVKNASGTLSDNFYWIHKSDDLKALDQLPAANITGSITRVENGTRNRYLLQLTNSGDGIAFMIACRLQGSGSGIELLPSLWNKNDINLISQRNHSARGRYQPA